MPSPSIALVHNLRRALRDGDLAEAASILAHLQHEAPLALETGALELELRVRGKRLDEADRLARQLAGRFPGSAHVHHWCGRAAYARRRYAEAEACFREAGKLAPHGMHDHWLGKTLTQLRRFDDAEAVLLRVVEVQAYDVAFELFAAAFAGCDDKQLSALEAAARKSGRVADLIALYEAAAPRRPSLYGRVRKLKPAGDAGG